MIGQGDYYTILGVSLTATPEEIMVAYREAARKHHPDKNRDNQEEATKIFKEINLAFENLYDPLKRAKYNRTRSHPPPPPPIKPKPKPGPKPVYQTGTKFPHNNGIFDVNENIPDNLRGSSSSGLGINDLWKQTGMEEYEAPKRSVPWPKRKPSAFIDP